MKKTKKKQIQQDQAFVKLRKISEFNKVFGF